MRSDKLIEQLCAILHRNFTISSHNIVNTPRTSAEAAATAMQNKIYSALKLHESQSLKDAAFFRAGKIFTFFSFSTINFFGGPPLPATTAV
jgi:hypothetical protein